MGTTTMDRPRPSIVASLHAEDVVWLSSTRPDGGPHLVPIWFLWDGESILVFSKPNAQKVRNLRADPRVMVAVGEPEAAFDVELIEAVAEVLPQPTKAILPSSFASKYRDHATRTGLSFDHFAATYSQPIRIRPTRWLGWGGPGWSG